MYAIYMYIFIHAIPHLVHGVTWTDGVWQSHIGNALGGAALDKHSLLSAGV